MQESSSGPSGHPHWHVLEWVCELAGTYLHVLAGVFAVVLGFASTSPLVDAIPAIATRRLIVGMLFVGSAVLVAVSPLGRRSGGHLNPAISTAFWIRGHLSGRDAIGYIGAQCLGAMAAVATAAGLAPHLVASIGYAVTRPGAGVSPAGAAGLEAAETAVVVLVIFRFVSSARLARFTPLAVWLLITSYVWALAPLTGSSVNPARSLGPAVVSTHLASFWVYVVGPITGAVMVALVWRRLGMPPTLTGKLRHDSRYPSAMRSALPCRPMPKPAET